MNSDWQQSIRELRDFEAAVSVADWSVDGAHIWPMVRVRYARLIQASAAGHVSRGRSSRWSEVVNVVRNAMPGQRTSRSWPSAHVIALSNGASVATVNGRSVDRFLYEPERQLDEVGIALTMLRPGGSNPIDAPASSIQRDVARARLRGGVPRRPPGWAEQYARASSALLDSVGLQLPPLANALREARTVAVLARRFERILQRGTHLPMAALIVNYYRLEGWALCVACQRLGVPTLEIQHGMQGELHGSYGGWDAVPPTSAGWPELPKRFLVWSDDEAESINGSRIHPAHQAIVTGRLDVRPPADEVMADVRSLRARSNRYESRVLVSLSGLEGEDVLDELRALVLAAPASFWFVRRHPVRPEQDLSLLEDLPNWETEKATRSWLPAVIEVADLHITEHSTVAVDAAEAGVRTLALSGEGVVRMSPSVPGVELVTPLSFEQALREGREPAAARRRQSLSVGEVIAREYGVSGGPEAAAGGVPGTAD